MANNKGKSLKDINFKQMAKDYKKPLLITAGIAAGAIGVKQIAKVINKDKQVSGLLGIDKEKLKKYVVPAGATIAGLAASQLINNQNGKLIAQGVAINGTILLANQVLNTNMLSGLGDVEMGNTPATSPGNEEENTLQLDLPLYELDEPVVHANNYIDNAMQDIPSHTPQAEPVSTRFEPEPKEVEVNLESNRPEDNFEVKRPESLPEVDENVSGTLEAIILPPEPQQYYDREFEEDLDFSSIP